MKSLDKVKSGNTWDCGQLVIICILLAFTADAPVTAVSGPIRCKLTPSGYEYVGYLSVTKKGFTCLPWATAADNVNFREGSSFPDGDIAAVSNYCRSPNRDEQGPWCYVDRAVAGASTDYCFVDYCGPTKCRISEHGQEYIGTVNTTLGGYTCQNWTSDIPQSHQFHDDSDFPDNSTELVKNYCRNPDLLGNPWCFTTNPAKRYDDCPVDSCGPADCKLTPSGSEYVGTLSKTKKGFTCQEWKLQTPQKHVFTQGSDFPDNSLDLVRNYCRSPDGDKNGPWCLTTDPNQRYDYCNIDYCGPTTCKTTLAGKEYIGKLNTTKNGHTCQPWKSDEPHGHNYNEGSYFPDGNSDLVSNYCRNPNGTSNGPYCYTTALTPLTDSCAIELCGPLTCKNTMMGKEYIGTVSVTRNGLACQAWDSDVPRAHNFHDGALFPENNVKLAKNYCRNPDNKTEGPWCFLARFTGAGEEFGYCDVKFCETSTTSGMTTSGGSTMSGVTTATTKPPPASVTSGTRPSLPPVASVTIATGPTTRPSGSVTSLRPTPQVSGAPGPTGGSVSPATRANPSVTAATAATTSAGTVTRPTGASPATVAVSPTTRAITLGSVTRPSGATTSSGSVAPSIGATTSTGSVAPSLRTTPAIGPSPSRGSVTPSAGSVTPSFGPPGASVSPIVGTTKSLSPAGQSSPGPSNGQSPSGSNQPTSASLSELNTTSSSGSISSATFGLIGGLVAGGLVLLVLGLFLLWLCCSPMAPFILGRRRYVDDYPEDNSPAPYYTRFDDQGGMPIFSGMPLSPPAEPPLYRRMMYNYSPRQSWEWTT